MLKIFHLIRFLLQASRTYFRSDLVMLSELFRTDKGFYNHNYVRIYEKIFSGLRDKHIQLLEIGLLSHVIQKNEPKLLYNETPSLKLWSKYFPSAKIVGYDLRDFSKPKNSRIKIIKGDQAKREDLSRILDVSKDFDVIIDDALHASRHQQITFSYLFQFLKPGGIFVIEDLHFQPHEFEDASTPKTVDLLYQLLHTGKWNSPHCLESEKKTIEESIDRILFFDSLKKNIRNDGRDAIAVIFKKK